MAPQIGFIRDWSKQQGDPNENHAWGKFSASNLHFYIIWSQYSFCFSFYSILKPSFFFGHHPAPGLAPDLLSSFFCVSAPHQLQGLHRALCSSRTTAPLPAVSTLSSAGNVLPNPGVAGSFLSSDSSSSANASENLKLATSCCIAPQILFFTLRFITLSSLICFYLPLCLFSVHFKMEPQ